MIGLVRQELPSGHKDSKHFEKNCGFTFQTNPWIHRALVAQRKQETATQGAPARSDQRSRASASLFSVVILLHLLVLNRFRRPLAVQGPNLELPAYGNGRWGIADRLVASLIVQLATDGYGFPMGT